MRRVLIVDDDAADAIMMREALHEVAPHVRIETAYDLDMAIWRYVGEATCRTDVWHRVPDLIVVGVARVGSAGCQFVRQMKHNARRARIPVVAISAAPCSGEKKRECTSWIHSLLPKPEDYRGYKELFVHLLRELRLPHGTSTWVDSENAIPPEQIRSARARPEADSSRPKPCPLA